MLYNFCLKHFPFQEELGEIWSKMHIGLHVEYPLFLSDFNGTNFRDRYSKNTQIKKFMKIRPVGIELFHAERQAWRSQQTLFVIFRTRLMSCPWKTQKFKVVPAMLCSKQPRGANIMI